MENIEWFNDLRQYLLSHHQRPLRLKESALSYNVASFIEQRQSPSFSEKLLDFIDAKSLNDTEVYKRAGIDRKLFSKIRSHPNYQPKKKTAFLLCLGLQLTIEEADTLLRCAGYSFSNSHTLDLIVQYCIEQGIYEIIEINFALEHYNIEPF